MLYVAANEEYLKINEVVKTPVIEFLTFINFLQRKNELDMLKLQRSTNR